MMDQTPEYIKMCEKAMPDLGTFDTFDVPYFDTERGTLRSSMYLKICIPLYTQDQLQAMVYQSRKDDEGFEYGLLDIWEKFQRFMDTDYPNGKFMNTINFFDSFEQGWLMFVMLVKHNKIWNGTDWVRK